MIKTINVIKVSKKQSGFTLIELMFTLAVLAIIAAFAVPGFSNLIQKNKSKSASSSLMSSLAFARTEAVTRSASVLVLANSGDWSKGFTIGVDENDDGDLSDTNDELLRSFEALDGVTSSSSISTIEFNAQGENTANASQSITLTPKSCVGTEKREITVGITGLVKVEKKSC